MAADSEGLQEHIRTIKDEEVKEGTYEPKTEELALAFGLRVRQRDSGFGHPECPSRQTAKSSAEEDKPLGAKAVATKGLA